MGERKNRHAVASWLVWDFLRWECRPGGRCRRKKVGVTLRVGKRVTRDGGKSVLIIVKGAFSRNLLASVKGTGL
jgi:hypothetical protein